MRASTSTRCAARGGSGAPAAIRMRNASTRTPASTSTPPAAAGGDVERAAHAERDVRRRRGARGAAGERRERVRHALERALAEEAADRDRGNAAGDLARAVGAREALERVAQRRSGELRPRPGCQPSSRWDRCATASASDPCSPALWSTSRAARSASAASGAATALSGAPPCGVPSVIRPATSVGFAAANARAARPAVECATRITGRPPRSSRIRATTAATCAVTASSSPPGSARSAV